MYSAKDILLNKSYTKFTVNGHKFSLPTFIYDNEIFINDDDYELSIDADFDPELFEAELMEYISTGSYERTSADMQTYKHFYIDISIPLSQFVSKYVAHQYKLLDWICWKYSRKIERGFGENCNILGDIMDIVCFGGELEDETYIEAIKTVLKTHFRNLWDKMKSHKENGFPRHCVVLSNLSQLYRGFVPEFLKELGLYFGVTIKHEIPDVHYCDRNPDLVKWVRHEDKMERRVRKNIAAEYDIYRVKTDTIKNMDISFIRPFNKHITKRGLKIIEGMGKEVCIIAHEACAPKIGNPSLAKINSYLYEACEYCYEHDSCSAQIIGRKSGNKRRNNYKVKMLYVDGVFICTPNIFDVVDDDIYKLGFIQSWDLKFE